MSLYQWNLSDSQEHVNEQEILEKRTSCHGNEQASCAAKIKRFKISVLIKFIEQSFEESVEFRT